MFLRTNVHTNFSCLFSPRMQMYYNTIKKNLWAIKTYCSKFLSGSHRIHSFHTGTRKRRKASAWHFHFGFTKVLFHVTIFYQKVSNSSQFVIFSTFVFDKVTKDFLLPKATHAIMCVRQWKLFSDLERTILIPRPCSHRAVLYSWYFDLVLSLVSIVPRKCSPIIYQGNAHLLFTREMFWTQLSWDRTSNELGKRSVWISPNCHQIPIHE